MHVTVSFLNGIPTSTLWHTVISYHLRAASFQSGIVSELEVPVTHARSHRCWAVGWFFHNSVPQHLAWKDTVSLGHTSKRPQLGEATAPFLYPCHDLRPKIGCLTACSLAPKSVHSSTGRRGNDCFDRLS